MRSYYGASYRHVSSYDKLIAFPPCPTYLFQFVGVYPWFQHFFVLLEVMGGESSYKQLIREYGDILIVCGPLVTVWSSGESICTTVVLSWYML